MLIFPPPIWMFIYLLIAAVISYLAGWPAVPGLPIVPLAIALIVLGLAISASGFLTFRREDTEIEPTSPTNRKLVISGPYRFTRNPMYLGLVVVTIGVAFWVGAWPMFLVPIAVFATVNLVHIPFEEAKMRRQFGEAFDAYTRKVRRWI